MHGKSPVLPAASRSDPSLSSPLPHLSQLCVQLSMSIAPQPPTLSAEALATVEKIEEAWKANAKVIAEKNLVLVVFNAKLEPLWSTEKEKSPAMLKKVAKSKAKSFAAGKTMANPKGANLM